MVSDGEHRWSEAGGGWWWLVWGSELALCDLGRMRSNEMYRQGSSGWVVTVRQELESGAIGGKVSRCSQLAL